MAVVAARIYIDVPCATSAPGPEMVGRYGQGRSSGLVGYVVTTHARVSRLAITDTGKHMLALPRG